jgi:hypothetical protein
MFSIWGNEVQSVISVELSPSELYKGSMMKRLLPFVKNATKYMPLFVLILFALSACASRSYMKINYQLPDKIENKPAITEIRLSVVDQRTNPDPLSITARDKLKNFHESYMLIMAPKGKDTPVSGIYDLIALFETVFRKRLDQMGIRVVDSTSLKIPKLEEAVTLFQLDLRDYKWYFKMSYAAKLVKDGNTLVKQTISGESERVDVPGMDDSGTTVSEVYADLINQLDIAALLNK